jgi:cytochrome c553
MSPVAKALSEDDISDVAAYYAGATAPFLPLAETASAALIAQGERLANTGNAAKGFPAASTATERTVLGSRRRSRTSADNTGTTFPSS